MSTSSISLAFKLFIRYSGQYKLLFLASSVANFFSSLFEAILAISLPLLVSQFFAGNNKTTLQYFHVFSEPSVFILTVAAALALKNYSLYISARYSASVSCAYLKDFCTSFYEQDIDSIKKTTKENLSSFIQGNFPLIGREVFFPSTQIFSSGVFICILLVSIFNTDEVDISLLGILLITMVVSYILTSLFTSKKLVKLGSKVKDIIHSQGDLVGFLHTTSLDDAYSSKPYQYSQMLNNNDYRLKKIQIKAVLLTSLPKSLAESSLLIVLVISVIVASQHAGIISVSSSALIGSFYILFKLLSAVQLLSRSIFLLKSNAEILNLLESNLHEFKINKVRDYVQFETFLDPRILLKVCSLVVNSRLMKSKLNFIVNEGDICLIDAQSGIGKSRLMYTLTGKLEPLEGSVRFNRIIPLNQSFPFLVAQKQQLISGIVNDMIDFGTIPETVEYIQKLYSIYDVDVKVFTDGIGFNDNIQSFLESSAHDLSGGQLQRVLILKSLTCQNMLLILDEPTSNLDSITESKCLSELVKFVTKRPKTALVYTSHSFNAKHFATKVISLS
ncbi:ABC transporter type 1 [Synechococcus sp. PROS-9-1]|uniref:ABC transporter ATP-binding protein n=1 Tax=Synechococcus sp. PROS-9-1 TaxID=1968775 RepID=UPI0016494048|nr:ABC transporter ATP-binding protein [Synechococcus sp. PROS-9-1]QNJ30634.1 ABC transporter type 1 [Synechococcus sp. PROS-9-1]